MESVKVERSLVRGRQCECVCGLVLGAPDTHRPCVRLCVALNSTLSRCVQPVILAASIHFTSFRSNTLPTSHPPLRFRVQPTLRSPPPPTTSSPSDVSAIVLLQTRHRDRLSRGVLMSNSVRG